MKYQIIIIFFLLLIFLTGCATSKEKYNNDIITKSSSDAISSAKINPNRFATFDNLVIKASLSINFPNQKNSVLSSIEIAGMDSILIKITAFLGINVGQLYANKNEFIMNNNLESITYIGIPTEENIMKTAFIPLSFADLISILKCIPTQNISNYKYKNDVNIFEFIDENKIEQITIDVSDRISKIVRIDKNGNEIFSVEYDNYFELNEKNIAKKIIIKFPYQAGNLEINYSDIRINDKPTSPMKIAKPKSYKLKEF